MKYIKTYENLNYKPKVGDFVRDIHDDNHYVWHVIKVEQKEAKWGYNGKDSRGMEYVLTDLNNKHTHTIHDWKCKDLEKVSKEEEKEFKIKVDSNKYNL